MAETPTTDQPPQRRRRRRVLLAGALAVLLGVVVAVVATRGGDEVVVPDPGDVRSADAFVDSLGVAVHLQQHPEDYDLFAQTLDGLGVRHIRTGGTGDRFFRQVNDLHETYGISSLVVLDPRDGYDSESAVEEGVLPVLPALDGVEGPNEWDINPQLEYDGEAWPAGVVDFANGLHDAVKGYEDDDADTQAQVRALSVVSPSVADPDAAAELTDVRCDLASVHSYPGGGLPDRELTTTWMPSALQLCGGRGVVATESGYCNTLTPEGCTNQGGVSEEASAKYALRHYFDYFRAGVERDYLYNLSTNDWDLFLRADGSRKPAYDAVRSAVQLLEDPGPVVNPTRFDVGVDAPDDVHHVLLQKRDGSYWMALWTNALSYPAGQECCDVDTARDVTLTLPAERVATVYSPTFAGTEPVESPGRTSTLTLSVPDQVLLVHLESP